MIKKYETEVHFSTEAPDIPEGAILCTIGARGKRDYYRVESQLDGSTMEVSKLPWWRGAVCRVKDWFRSVRRWFR